MTDVGGPRKTRIRRLLVDSCIQVLERDGWRVTKVSGFGSARIRRITKGPQQQARRNPNDAGPVACVPAHQGRLAVGDVVQGGRGGRRFGGPRRSAVGSDSHDRRRRTARSLRPRLCRSSRRASHHSARPRRVDRPIPERGDRPGSASRGGRRDRKPTYRSSASCRSRLADHRFAGRSRAAGGRRERPGRKSAHHRSGEGGACAVVRRRPLEYQDHGRGIDAHRREAVRPARAHRLSATVGVAEIRVVFSARARRDLRRIDAPARTRIVAGIELYAGTGVGDVKRVQTRAELRLRVGDWRVFFRRAGEGGIEIDAILHRREAYRRP